MSPDETVVVHGLPARHRALRDALETAAVVHRADATLAGVLGLDAAILLCMGVLAARPGWGVVFLPMAVVPVTLLALAWLHRRAARRVRIALAADAGGAS